ncbi:MAG: DUF2079 domain-containing protein [Patescibacteria group bacterium]
MKVIKKLLNLVSKHIDLITYLFIAFYTLLALSVSLGRFWQFQSFYYDFGIFDSAIWKVAHFQLPIINHVNFAGIDRIIFADHFNPSIFLLSPFYWVTQRQEMLLVVQVLAVSGGALISYKLARKTLKSKVASLSLVVAFLGYVGMQNALISDFHEATIAVLFLMLLFWAMLKKRWGWYFVCLLIILGFKESFAGLGVGLGLILLIRKTNWKVALGTILISMVWGFVVIKYVIPYYSGGFYYFAPTKLPQTLGELVIAITVPPSKVKAVIYSFATFGFLPLFNLSVLPAIFENFFERFVLSSYKGVDLGMHYNATLSPLMFMGALGVFVWIEKRKKLAKFSGILGGFIILIVLFLHRFTLRGPLALGYNRVFYQQFQASNYVRNFVKEIPDGGLVMTQNDLAVRFTHGKLMLITLDYIKYSPDTVVLNLTPGQNPNSLYPLGYEGSTKLKDELLKDENYQLTKFADELYLFTKK